ncbi:calcium-binding protein [Methylobacterium sp. Leaf123]|uniref:M10 family metallopeptidase C-terminal domain-containing protein n=1 Tax=Methylobacterium sp. Leaf123 TaxID=1736264 RepID=UPI0006F1CBBC|nr:M10 family metallopeptidase C-terminal domain-containing protein [Methylobacterium sp. Leaf123]KQQ12968.1 calcium-binding protein [Methylobacterium sp. Leaf123]
MVETSTSEKSDSSLINAVLAPNKWDANTLNYGFQIQDIDQNGISDFNEGQWRGFYESIFDNISSFTNLNFRETSFEESTLGQILTVGGGGSSFDPHQGMPQGNTHTSVGIGGTVAGASDVVFRGQWSEVWYHEIGHSLGLDHPFERPGAIAGVRSDADLGTNFINSSLYTVMSYSPFAWGEDNPWTTAKDAGKTFLNASVGSYMPLDIAALQHLYGAKAANTGDTVYTFGDDLRTNAGFNTIWDTGGDDTIQYVGTSRAKIDLRAATLQDEIGGGGFLSTSETLTGGFLVANGVAIEAAIGGAKDDILHGQELNNLLIGNAGNDRLFGHAGDDLLDGGTGSDRLDGGEGNDQARFSGGSQDYAIVYNANAHEDVFTIKHIASGAIDTLTSIESLVFNDTVLGSHALFANLEAQYGPIAAGDPSSLQVTLSPGADDPLPTDIGDIDGAFAASAKAVFNDLDGGSWQRVFDFGNGPDSDNVYLGQIDTSSDMQFTIFNGNQFASIIAYGAIEEGREAIWAVDVDAVGWMRLFKDGELLAEGQGIVPRDIDRANEFVGKSNWGADTPLIGEVSELTVTSHNPIPEIDGAFQVSADVRFDDLGSGFYQRVFDTGNGPDSDNIWLGQVDNGDDMAFEILTGSTKHRITALDTIVEGETAKWQASVDEGGMMRLFKNDHLVAEGQGAVPLDVERTSDLVGQSNWWWDTQLAGKVRDLLFA